jgi:outer membrane receptor protein involved in Fe transport
VYLGATYFDYRIDNMIATYTIQDFASAPAVVQNICGGVNLTPCGGDGKPKYYTNDQNGASNGYELVGKWKLNNQYTINASYTFTSTYLTSRKAGVTDPLNTQLAGVPKEAVTLGLTWKPSDKVRMYGQARYIGRYYIDTTTAGGPYEAAANVIYDASASYAWDKKVDVAVSVINLANKEYSEGTYSPTSPWTQTVSAPRTLNMSLRVKF